MSKRRYEERYTHISNPAIAKAIEEWIRSKQDRRIARAAMLDHETYASIGEAEKLDERTVSRRMEKIENIIWKHV